jgi:hypothetical protein
LYVWFMICEQYCTWLVVWNLEHEFYFHTIWDSPSHWLIFFKMVKTTNQVL